MLVGVGECFADTRAKSLDEMERYGIGYLQQSKRFWEVITLPRLRVEQIGGNE